MTTIRKTIFTAVAATFMVVSLQPASAGGGGFAPGVIKPGVLKPGIVNPGVVKPGVLKPGLGKIKPLKPKKPHHNNGNAAAAAAIGIVGGMIIGNAIANSNNRAVPVNNNAHIAWCSGRYKTYDWQSDTYMSNSGYRKYCNSPYN